MRPVREGPAGKGPQRIILRCPDCGRVLPASRVVIDGSPTDVISLDLGIDPTGQRDGLRVYQGRIDAKGRNRDVRHGWLSDEASLAYITGEIRDLAPGVRDVESGTTDAEAWVRDTLAEMGDSRGTGPRPRPGRTEDAPIGVRCPGCRCVALIPRLASVEPGV